MKRRWQVELSQARRRVRVLEYLLERAERKAPEPEKPDRPATMMEQVMEALKEFGMQTPQELSNRTGLEKRQVSNALRGLVETSKVKLHRTVKDHGKWSIVTYALLLSLLIGCQQPPDVTIGSGGPVVTNRPSPEVGWPVQYVTNKMPSLPRIKAMPGDAVQTLTESRSIIVPQPIAGAQLILQWEAADRDFITGYYVWNTNGVKLMTVARDYDNCTVTNLRPGEFSSFYLTAFLRVPVLTAGNIPTVEWQELESGRSNTNGALAGVPPRGFYLTPQSHSFAYTWKCAPGVTNALQSTADLKQWQTVVRFMGTNGTARVEATNSEPRQFFRVALLNSTNAPSRLTNTVAKVRLEWIGDGREKNIQGLADPATGSYVTIATSSQQGPVAIITSQLHARYRIVNR